MAHETQTAQFSAAMSPSNQSGPSRSTATKSISHFLSLPEGVFYTIFQLLSWEFGLAGDGSKQALSLAATCRQLNQYYRLGFVNAISLGIAPDTESDILFRALARFPRVHTISLTEFRLPPRRPLHKRVKCVCRRHSSLPLMSRDVAEVFLSVLREASSPYEIASPQSRELPIKALHLRKKLLISDNSEELSTQTVRSAVQAFPNLEILDLSTFYAASDDAVASIAKNLSHSLKVLSLCHLMSDVGGAHIGKLHCLKSLELRSCKRLEVTDSTFDGLSTLVELETLVLYNCSISDESACRLLPKLRKLKTLDLSWCLCITSAVFPFLPRLLRKLEISSPGAVTNGEPSFPLDGVFYLTCFVARGCEEVNDLWFLGPVAPRLKVLCLSGIGASDANVAHWVRQMLNMEELDLSVSSVSDETARAVSTLQKMKRAILNRTKITNDGVRALANGVACQALEVLDLTRCSKIRVEDGAVDVLSRAISKKGYGRMKLTE